MRSAGFSWIAVIGCAAITPAFASNGINVIGYSGESEMMGGADVAVARDISALATNPAGLVQIVNAEMDIFASPYYAVDIGHRDTLGNDLKSTPRVGAVGGGGFAQHLNRDVVLGAGLFVQGGVGYDYENLDSGFGARGQLSGIFGIYKLTPGVAWRISDQWSIGAGLNLIYASARQKLFPDASIANEQTPEASFYGRRIDGLSAFGTGYKLGLRYQPNPAWTVGLSFGSRTPLDLKDGEMTVNYEALGQGRVVYSDARIDGLATAQDVSLGVAYRPVPRWLLSGELSWLDWSKAIGIITTTASKPEGNIDPALVPAEVPATITPLNYNDQIVIALGFSYDWDDKTRLRGGINWGEHPTPNENLNPLFAVIGQHHVSFGVARDLSPKWELGVGVQVQGPREERYKNPSAPFTADAVESNFALWLSTSLIRRW